MAKIMELRETNPALFKQLLKGLLQSAPSDKTQTMLDFFGSLTDHFNYIDKVWLHADEETVQEIINREKAKDIDRGGMGVRPSAPLGGGPGAKGAGGLRGKLK